MSDEPRWVREYASADFADDFKRALGVEQFELWERPQLNTVPMGFRYARWKEKTPAGTVEHVATIIFRECQPCSLVFRMWEDAPRACPGCEARSAGITQPDRHVVVFDDGRFEFVRRFSVLAEAQAVKDGIEACPSLHSTGESVYLLPGQEAAMRLDQHADEVAKAAKAIAAADEVAT